MIRGEMMFFIILCALFGCVTDAKDGSLSSQHSGDPSCTQDISHIQSPCLDGIFKNMIDRNCTVDTVTDDNGMTRYMCIQETIEPWDVWTTRAFSSWESAHIPDQEYLDENGYNLACADWSLGIFYR